jgi:uncharacterized protein
MKCPTCPDATLVMAERQGVEIDYCPQCRGVWLDRGELDKLIERAAGAPAPAAAPVQPGYAPQPRYRDDDDDRRRHFGHGHYKKKSWLSDIFD